PAALRATPLTGGRSGAHADLHSLPTRRSSDLEVIASLPWVASTSVTILAADDGHIDPRASAREVAELFETSDVVIEPCPTKPHKDRKSTRLNSSHVKNSYAVCCLKKKRSSDET